MMDRCKVRSSARISGSALITETFSVTSCERISCEISFPSKKIFGSRGSELKEIGESMTAEIMSFGLSLFIYKARKVIARYNAPVSK
jgi:hypothetical protein